MLRETYKTREVCAGRKVASPVEQNQVPDGREPLPFWVKFRQAAVFPCCAHPAFYYCGHKFPGIVVKEREGKGTSEPYIACTHSEITAPLVTSVKPSVHGAAAP